MIWSRWRALRSLHARLFVALAVTGLLPLAVVGVGGAVASRQVIAEQSARELAGLAVGISGHVDMYLGDLLQDARMVAGLPDIASMDPSRQGRILQFLAPGRSDFTRLSVFDRAGVGVASSHPDALPSVADRPWFRALVERGEQSWGVAPSIVAGRWSLMIGTPIVDAGGRVVGVLGAVVDLAEVSERLANMSFGKEAQAFVLDQNGRVLLHPDPAEVQGRRDYAWLALPTSGPAMATGTLSFVQADVAYVAGYARVANAGWTVLVGRPEADVLAPAEQSWRLALAGLAASMLLALFAAGVLAGMLTRPLRALAAAARAFGEGDAHAPLPKVSPDDGEIGTLVDSFATMRADVATRTAALERLHAASTVLHHTAELDATLAALVEHAVELTGASRGGLALPQDGELSVQHVCGAEGAPDASAAAPAKLELIRTVYQNGEPLVVNAPSDGHDAAPRSFLAVPLVSRARTLGVLCVCSKRAGPFTTEDRRLLMTLASEVAIVLEHADLLREAAHAAALRELNRQQRLFINMVAHELRTPLSYMVGYSELLLHREPTPELLREGLSTIYRGSLQLRDIVTDIIELSQLEAGQVALDRLSVDIGHLVPGWVAELASPPRVEVHVAEGVPPVVGDPLRLRHAVNHLVRNALKFSGPDTVVTVEVARQDEQVVIRVSDRGCGIRQEEADKVFDLFFRTERSHAEAVPGSGLGLALVKRLVDLHHGRVDLHSVVGVGSTFTIVLPAAGPEADPAQAGCHAASVQSEGV